MPMMIGAGMGLVGGLMKTITGGKQKREGKRILANNPMPEYNVPSEITAAAAEGLPSEQYAQAMKNIQRQQATALSGAQDRRGGVAAVGAIQRNTNDAAGNLDVANAMARQKNLMTLAQYKDKAWDWNKKQKYERNYNYGQSLIGAGNQNKMSGLDQMVGAGGNAAMGMFGNGGGFIGGYDGSRPTGGSTTYYNGYNQGSNYGAFQNPFE